MSLGRDQFSQCEAEKLIVTLEQCDMFLYPKTTKDTIYSQRSDLKNVDIWQIKSTFSFTVNRIKEQYKVSVRIPQDSERSGLVRIEGDPKGVQLARRELIEMVQRMVSQSWRRFNRSLWQPVLWTCFFLPPIFRRTSAPKIWSWSRSSIGQSSARREKRSKKSETSSLRWALSLTPRKRHLACLSL